jgi:tetratricopeptide (TPR) repeat protein
MQAFVTGNQQEKPAVDNYFRGNYETALHQFAQNPVAGFGHSWKIATCLLRLGRSDEALATFDKPVDEDPQDYYDLRIALAVASKNERELQDAVRRAAGYRILSQTGVSFADRRKIGQPATLDSKAFAKWMMASACSFGDKYDYQTMHLVANEAMKRGATDLESLSDYAAECRSNGDVRQALSLAEKAESLASGRDRVVAHGVVYDLKNLIYQYSKVRPIAEQEKRWHEASDSFYRKLWINDLASSEADKLRAASSP